MRDETKKLTEEEIKQICESTKRELFKFADHVDAALTTLETFLPNDVRVTIIVRKENEHPGVDLAGAMIRTNDDPEKLVQIMRPMAKAVHDHPEQFR